MSDPNDPTRRSDLPPPDGTARPQDQGDPTQAMGGHPDDAGATQQMDATAAGTGAPEDPPWEGVAQQSPDGPPGTRPGDELEEEPEPEKRPGRDATFALIGLIVGVIVAFIIIALGSGDAVDEVAEEDPAAAAQVEELEAQVEERDAQIEDLEAQLAEAEAAAGERDEDIQAQQDALDDRAEGLDQRAAQLDEREAALNEREAAIEQREAEADQPADEPDDGNGNGLDTDDLTEDAETIIDEVLSRIRDLFGGN